MALQRGFALGCFAAFLAAGRSHCRSSVVVARCSLDSAVLSAVLSRPGVALSWHVCFTVRFCFAVVAFVSSALLSTSQFALCFLVVWLGLEVSARSVLELALRPLRTPPLGRWQ